MARTSLRSRFLGRHSVRARMALACVGLFLFMGVAFVVATYTLVDHSLSSHPQGLPRGEPTAIVQACTAAKASHNAGRIAQCSQLGSPDVRTRALHVLLLWSLVDLGVATVLAAVVWWAIGRRVLRPLSAVTAAAQRASQEHLDERINLDGPDDELKELADTFDDMLNRLDLAFASQRRFVANASHELRTPLTSSRTLIDVAMAKSNRTIEQLETLIGRVRESVDQSEAIIDGLLTLARSDRGLTAHELVDLEAAAQDAIDQVVPAARDSDVIISADLSSGPTLGDRVLLERLVANLLDNAVRYNIAGGLIAVATGTKDDVSYITVTNTGPIVPEPELASLFEPFTRLDGRVSHGLGVGLGLSIVTSVVNAHHGDLHAVAHPTGGMTISVRLRSGWAGSPGSSIAQVPTPGSMPK
jgi:signal transduction histidine kinase